MPTDFSFTLPDPVPLKNSKTKDKSAHSSCQPIPFPDMLNQRAGVMTTLSTGHRGALQSCLKQIWDSALSRTNPEPNIRIQYKELFEQNIQIKALISVAIEARNRTIETARKMEIDKKGNSQSQSQHLLEIQTRVCFMIGIVSILENQLYLPEFSIERRCLLLSIFRDIHCILKNIGMGLYDQHFTDNYVELAKCFDQTLKMTETLFPAVSFQLQQSSLASDREALHSILIFIMYFPLFKAQYYFAFGSDEIAFSYLNKDHYLSKGPLFGMLHAKGETNAQDIYKHICEEIIQKNGLLQLDIQLNQKRKLYIRLHSYIKKHFHSRCDGTDIRCSNLKSNIQSNLAKLLKATAITSDTIDDIEQCILSLHLARLRNYDQDLELLAFCSQIINHLKQKIFHQDKGSVITASIDAHLTSYTTLMKTSEEVIQQSLSEATSKHQPHCVKDEKTQDTLDTASLKKTKLENRLTSAQQTIMHHSREIAALKQQNALLHTKCDQAKTLKDQEQQQKQVITQQIEQLQEEVTVLKQENTSLTKAECDQAKTLKDQEQQQQVMTQQIKQLQEEVTVLKQENASLTEACLITKIDKEAQLHQNTLNEEAIKWLYHKKESYKRRRNFHKNKSIAIQAQLNAAVTLKTNTQIQTDTIIKQNTAENMQLKEYIQTLQAQITQMHAAYTQLQQKIQRLQKAAQQPHQVHHLYAPMQTLTLCYPPHITYPSYTPAAHSYYRSQPKVSNNTSKPVTDSTFVKLVDFSKSSI